MSEQVQEQRPERRGGAPPGMESMSLKYINDVNFIPEEVQRQMWGWSNHQYGLRKYTPAQARAQIHRINAQAVFVKASTPKWQIDDTFIDNLDSFINHSKTQIYGAQIPRNERELIATSVQETNVISKNPTRKRFLGVF